jgi:pimeloyl-ACP methyl ester carboxylesterase
MEKTRSADGTTIAFDRYGEGRPLVVVMGATAHRAISPNMANLAHLVGGQVFVYDRRGRGDSGDTMPYAVEREVEDLAAVLAVAGGEAAVFGHSSGAVLALDAAAAGLPVTRLALYDTPVKVDDSAPPSPRDYLARLEAAAGPEERLEIFWTTIGMPAEQRARMRGLPVWAAFRSVGDTVVYDARLIEGLGYGEALPPERWAGVRIPTLVMAGGAGPEFFRSGARAITALLPDARYEVLDGQGHGPADDVLAASLRAFLA